MVPKVKGFHNTKGAISQSYWWTEFSMRFIVSRILWNWYCHNRTELWLRIWTQEVSTGFGGTIGSYSGNPGQKHCARRLFYCWSLYSWLDRYTYSPLSASGPHSREYSQQDCFALTFLGAFWSSGRNTAANISLFVGTEGQNSEKFGEISQICAISWSAPLQIITKISSLPLILGVGVRLLRSSKI